MKGSIPMRKCVGCGVSRPKQELLRIVMTAEGAAMLDRSGKANGRGAYLCDDRACLAQARKRNSFSRSFRKTVDAAVLEQLEHELTEHG